MSAYRCLLWLPCAGPTECLANVWEQIYSLDVFISPSGIFSHLRTPIPYHLKIILKEPLQRMQHRHPHLTTSECWHHPLNIKQSLDSTDVQSLLSDRDFQDTCSEYTICQKPNPMGWQQSVSLGNVPSNYLEKCSFLLVEEEEDSWQEVAILDTPAAQAHPTEGRRLKVGQCPLLIELSLTLENACTLWSIRMAEFDLGGVLGEQCCFQRWVCLLTLGSHCEQLVKCKSLSWCFLASGPSLPHHDPLVCLGECLVLTILLVCVILHPHTDTCKYVNHRVSRLPSLNILTSSSQSTSPFLLRLA